jgi:hypothetical protein
MTRMHSSSPPRIPAPLPIIIPGSSPNLIPARAGIQTGPSNTIARDP